MSNNRGGKPSSKKESSGGSGWKVGRYTLVLLFFLVAALFISVIRSFLVSILVAATFATLFYPLFEAILNVMPRKGGSASIITCFILVICIFLPVSFLVAEVADQAIGLYRNAQPVIENLLAEGDDGFLDKVRDSKIYGWLDLDEVDWEKTLQQTAGKTGSIVASVINRTSRSLFELITNFFIIIFTMFYLFRDGGYIVRKIKALSPLKEQYNTMISESFTEISRATVRGTIIIGLIQGFMGTLILLFTGFSSWLVFGVIMAILSIIPLVGAWIVLVPAGIVKIISGDILTGVIIIALSVLVVSTVDNLLRPRLVGREAGMHDLLIFFSTLGGISLFGVAGFIVGPVVAALFLSVIEIWGKEFTPELEEDS